MQGAKDTFSGEKPCPLCCKIAAAKKADAEHGKPQDAPAPAMPAVKLPEFLATADDLLTPPAATALPPVVFVKPLSLHGIGAHSPPAPPPRAEA